MLFVNLPFSLDVTPSHTESRTPRVPGDCCQVLPVNLKQWLQWGSHLRGWSFKHWSKKEQVELAFEDFCWQIKVIPSVASISHTSVGVDTLFEGHQGFKTGEWRQLPELRITHFFWRGAQEVFDTGFHCSFNKNFHPKQHGRGDGNAKMEVLIANTNVIWWLTQPWLSVTANGMQWITNPTDYLVKNEFHSNTYAHQHGNTHT